MLSCRISKAQGQSSLDTLFSITAQNEVFSIEDYYAVILSNHPIAKQAQLLSEVARQEIRMAHGNFDPKLQAEFLTKDYNDKEYYTIFNSSLKIPTVFPINPSVGFEQNWGDYLNPERYIGNEFKYQQLYAGVSIPLGRGLITDERRAALKQAGLFKEMTTADQVKLINKLLLDAAKEYWQWYYAYYNYRLLSRGVTIASEIFRRVKINYQFGEAASIDTVQAKITLQQRQVEVKEAWVDFKNTGVSLSNNLWDSLGNPLDFNVNWAPVLRQESLVLTKESLAELVNQAKANHPELQKLRVKLRQLEVEKKLALEYLKPQLNLNYYFINQPFTPGGYSSFQFRNNYKLNVDFSFPVFLRKERSKVALTKLKLSNTRYEQTFAERQIINNIIEIHTELMALQSILGTQRSMVLGYERLLQAELLNLQQGESDLFKINVQLEKFNQSQTKWLKLVAEYEKQKSFLYWAAGIRNLALNSN